MADFFADLFLSPVNNPKKSAAKGNNSEKSARADTHHPACDVATPHIHEKAYVENSAGGDISEGCEEHYYDRIVTVDEKPTENGLDEKLAEYFVMGEILLHPKFRNNKFGRW